MHICRIPPLLLLLLLLMLLGMCAISSTNPWHPHCSLRSESQMRRIPLLLGIGHCRLLRIQRRDRVNQLVRSLIRHGCS
ncbi:hypothetical protein BX661DRAFT_180131 [Kickxella alabastrina]|uniref:uncharacterized protein n=1 Tax=Kickxella alabastrina TaxID=61397 RepID=UPI00221FF793|nr:uncharacterized protein BX661DRAFT_180131 [Kickxella alabastrina]KAI7830815.1 hypothetical protein BX661DRAFT_180131 [Kickxella alabastrina]